MTETERKAAVILAIADRAVHGDSAKPSGYWGVAPLEKAHELDDKLKDMTPEELNGVLDRLSVALEVA